MCAGSAPLLLIRGRFGCLGFDCQGPLPLWSWGYVGSSIVLLLSGSAGLVGLREGLLSGSTP